MLLLGSKDHLMAAVWNQALLEKFQCGQVHSCCSLAKGAIMWIESAGQVYIFQVCIAMFAANVLAGLGSPTNNVVGSFRADLLSEETIDTNHPSGVITDAGPDGLMKARSAAQPFCRFCPSSRPCAVCDLRSPVPRRLRMEHVGLRDLP